MVVLKVAVVFRDNTKIKSLSLRLLRLLRLLCQAVFDEKFHDKFSIDL